MEPDASSAFERAVAAFSARHFAQARDICREILRTDGDRAEFLNLLGVIANTESDPEEALSHFSRAVESEPGSALYWFNKGGTLSKLGRFPEAVACLSTALELAPSSAEIWLERSICFAKAGDFQSAIKDGEKALELSSEDGRVALNLAVALHEGGEIERAIAIYRSAAARLPGDANIHYRLGLAYQDAGDDRAAIPALEQAIRTKHDHAAARISLGISLNNVGRHADAIASFTEGLRLDPSIAKASWYIGKCLQRLGRETEAIDAYTAAVERGVRTGQLFTDRGHAYYCVGRYAEAKADYLVALDIEPDLASAHVNLAMLLLLTEDFKSGWNEYEWRWKLDDELVVRRTFDVPLWDGTNVAKGERILLHGEQGYGDVLQFCRYAPLVGRRGFRIVLEADQTLHALLCRLPDIDQVVSPGDRVAPAAAHCPLMSLPRILGTGLADIPSPPRYLDAPVEATARWRSRLGSGAIPRVGVAWRGNAMHLRDLQRSIDPDIFRAIFPAPCEFFSLQKEIGASDRAALDTCADLRHFGHELRDFGDTAALCEIMDLIITVDTSVAHLAGALGRPVWILLPYSPDWRWMLGRDDSPWYPTARLYRQPRLGDWLSVLERVRADLEARFATTGVTSDPLYPL